MDFQMLLTATEARKGERVAKFADSLAFRRLQGSNEDANDGLVQCLQGVYYKVGYVNGSPIYRQEPGAPDGANTSELFLVCIVHADEEHTFSRWVVSSTLDVGSILHCPDGCVYASGIGDQTTRPTELVKARGRAGEGVGEIEFCSAPATAVGLRRPMGATGPI